jgi:hypothetical protein
MVDSPVWAICERVAEVQALLDDHVAGGKHTAADVEGASGPVGIRIAPGNVRCRLLPAEHAAGCLISQQNWSRRPLALRSLQCRLTAEL